MTGIQKAQMEITDEYATKVLRAKKITPSKKKISIVKNALVKAYNNRVYTAVAFDVDGTLTPDGSIEIDNDICPLIRDLLVRGVHVILVSGRGRTSIRQAAAQIVKNGDIPISYLRRFTCVVHNGLTWLRTTSLSESSFLATEHELLEHTPGYLSNIQSAILSLSDFKHHFDGRINLSQEPTGKDHSLRIKYLNSLYQLDLELFNKFCRSVKSIIRSFNKDNASKVYLTFSKYGQDHLLNISISNKSKALELISKKLGITSDSILRVGDQGHKDGNDFDLLNGPNGFSVESLSKSLTRCFPILRSGNNARIKGVEATRYLISSVLLFPPLSLVADQEEQLRAFFEFEALAAKRARYEVKIFTEKLKIRIHRLIDAKDEFFDFHFFQLSDIFDLFTGAIILKPHEVYKSNSCLTAKGLFGLDDKIFSNQTDPKLEWSMFTDTDIMLRGPNYYWGLTHTKESLQSVNDFFAYTKSAIDFIQNSNSVLQDLAGEKPTLLAYKYYLAILDNIRNIALNLLYTANATQMDNEDVELKDFYRWNKTIADVNFRAFFDENYSWSDIFDNHSLRLRNFIESINKLTDRITKKVLFVPVKGYIRKWREADFFFENVISVSLGFHEFVNQGTIPLNNKGRGQGKIYGIGLVYGGIELPFLAWRIAKAHKIHIEIGLIEVSLYSNKNKRDRRIKDPLRELENYGKTFEDCRLFQSSKGKVEWKGKKVLLLDDNCTTGRTLELTRNLFVKNGCDVVGAITVRFPSSNRYAQMLLPAHGMLDPDTLLSFIRGFVTPNPYTRFFRRKTGKNKYLDATGVFDKAKNRVCKYLKKNGSLVDE